MINSTPGPGQQAPKGSKVTLNTVGAPGGGGDNGGNGGDDNGGGGGGFFGGPNGVAYRTED